MSVQLTLGERRVIWASSALLLAILVGLFFAGLFLNVRADSPMLPGFYWIANVVAATAAGVLASTITGFFKVYLTRRFGSKGKYVVQATGGFAVFLIVMWSNPRSQMFDLADRVFSSAILSCRQALSDPQTFPNGRALCEEVARQFPNRPEPLRYLGTWTHRNDPTVDGFQHAAEYYSKALFLYGVDLTCKKEPCVRADVDAYEKIELAEALLGFAFSNADWALSSFGSGHSNADNLRSDLLQSTRAFDIAIVVGNDSADPIFLAKAYDGLGKISLYSFFILGGGSGEIAQAISLYQKAINLKTRYGFFLRYHKFLALLIEHSGLSENDIGAQEEERIAFEDFINDWDSYIDNQYNVKFEPQIKRMFRQMVANSRNEEYVITRPFGSTLFGGDGFRSFLDREPLLARKLFVLLQEA